MKIASAHPALPVLLLASLVVTAIGCGSDDDGQTGFTPQEIHRSEQAVYALAWGDFDPRNSGNEAAALLADSAVLELFYEGSEWLTELLPKGEIEIDSMKNRSTIAVGDVDPDRDGSEIVLSARGFISQTPEGGAELTEVSYDPIDGWSREPIVNLDGLVVTAWGARVGEIFSDLEGDDVFYLVEFVFDEGTGFALRKVGGMWEGFELEDFVYRAEVGMDSVTGDVNPDHPGNEVVVVTEIGPAYELLPSPVREPGPWPRQTIWDDEDNVGWIAKIADIEPDMLGNEIAYGSRNSDSIMLSHRNSDGSHTFKVLFTGIGGDIEMWDIAVGDVLPVSPTLEIVGVDDTGSVYLVRKDDNQWTGEIIWTSPEGPLYAVEAQDFLGTGTGDQILVTGRSGAFTLLTR